MGSLFYGFVGVRTWKGVRVGSPFFSFECSFVLRPHGQSSRDCKVSLPVVRSVQVLWPLTLLIVPDSSCGLYLPRSRDHSNDIRESWPRFNWYGRGSSVGIATRYGLEGQGLETRCGLFSGPIHTGNETHATSCTMGVWYLFFRGVKWPGREVDLTPSSFESVYGTAIGKVHPRTGHEGTEREYRYISTLSLTSALQGVSG